MQKTARQSPVMTKASFHPSKFPVSWMVWSVKEELDSSLESESWPDCSALGSLPMVAMLSSFTAVEGPAKSWGEDNQGERIPEYHERVNQNGMSDAKLWKKNLWPFISNFVNLADPVGMSL
jgi:hypothetical protein